MNGVSSSSLFSQHNADSLKKSSTFNNEASAVLLATKSMQKIVTSIAAKLTPLILSSSDEAEKDEKSRISSSSISAAQIVSLAETVLSSLQDLIIVTKQTISHKYSDDRGVADEVEVSSQQLLLSGENLLLCCQVVASAGHYTKNSKHAASKKADLIECISKLFQRLVILLMCVDNAEVRQLVGCGNIVLDHLCRLNVTTSMESLIDHFSSFAVTVHRFHTGVMERCSDLLSSTVQHRMHLALTTLKHSMPMLATALNMALKYPHNKEANSSKSFAVKQVEQTIKDVISVLKAPPGAGSTGNDGQIGAFASCTLEINSMLNTENRYNLSALELETTVQSLVQHHMSLSAYLNSSIPKFTKKSNYLVKECQKLIEIASAISKLADHVKSPSSSSVAEDNSDFGSSCRLLRGKLKGITKNRNEVVYSMTSHTFTITTEPFSELIRVCQFVKGKRNSASLQKLNSSLGLFQSHCQDVSETVKFIGMCCGDPKLYADLQITSLNFKSLSTQVADFCRTFLSKNSDIDYDESDTESRFENFNKSWPVMLGNLIQLSARTLDLPQLTASIEAVISSEFDKCREELVNLDEARLSRHVINAIGAAKLLAIIANGVVSSSTDPIYRNGVLSHVNQLSQAIAHMIASGNQSIEDVSKLSSQESFLAASDSLKTRSGDVRTALLSKSNHPQLTSDERKGLRCFPDKSQITGMIREMRNLNKKLSSLGFEPDIHGLKFSSEDEKRDVTTPASSEYIDGLFGTSGDPVEISDSNEESQNAVCFGRGVHPIAVQILKVHSSEVIDEASTTRSYSEMKEMTSFLNRIIEHSESSIKLSKVLVTDITTDPVFVTSQDKCKEKQSIEEVLKIWRETLNESCNLVDGLSLEQGQSSETLNSLCQSWSKSVRIIVGSCLKTLQIHTLCVRRFLAISATLDAVPTSIENRTPPEGDNTSATAEIEEFMSKPHDGLEMLGRIAETLLILLSDVSTFYRRKQRSKKGEEAKIEALVLRIDAMRDGSKQLVLDMGAARQELKKRAGRCMIDNKLDEIGLSWLPVYALVCASKLSALSSNVRTMTQLVLGVKSLHLPFEYFLCGDDADLKLLTTYKARVGALAASVIEKTNKVINGSSLDTREVLKLRKVRDRMEISCQSIQKILKYLLKRKFSKDFLFHHGFLVGHLMFLHQRFLLESSRMSLVVEELRQLSTASNDAQNEDIHSPCGKVTTDGATSIPPNAPKQNAGLQEKSFDQRLSALTEERKKREKDLFLLLSDVDNEEQFAAMAFEEAENPSVQVRNESDC